ncbi:MAG: SIS domain-containing protein, partial [Dehalococcoidia bacterium]|nr:SIS domain-containing protein [Dehalococcoidia bacterium]
ASSAQGPARARLVEAGELLHYGAAAVGPDEVIVAISQSGESVETRRLVEQVRGARVLGITNQDGAGEFCRLCDVVLPILAGPESAVSTKTHVNSLLVAMRLVAALGWQDAAPRDALERCPEALEQVVADCFRRAEEAVAFLGPAPNLTVVARGPVSAARASGPASPGTKR